jgi:opacity protein-like surface antigen
MKNSYSLLAALGFIGGLSLLSSSALANGLYVEGHAGFSIPQTSDINGLGIPAELSFDNSGVYGGAVGYNFGNFRAEGEISYRNADIDEVRFPSVPLTVSSGADISALSFMANGYYDIKTGTAFTPFVGGGLGLAVLSSNNSSSGSVTGNDSSTVFAWQVGGGLSYALNSKLSLQASYRYFATAEGSFAGASNVDVSFASHELLAGIRYSF